LLSYTPVERVLGILGRCRNEDELVGGHIAEADMSKSVGGRVHRLDALAKFDRHCAVLHVDVDANAVLVEMRFL
jgi:hypothetical protein